MVRKELTDLIPIWGLYDLYRRKDEVLDFHAREALRENDRVQRMVDIGQINSAEQRQRCDALLKEFKGNCRGIIVYSAGLAAYNLVAAYGFLKLVEYFAK